MQGPVFLIETGHITANPDQPRREFNEDELRELAASIREFGILQPIIVSKIEKETPTGTEVEYQLIAGERRWRAAKLLGLERVPAIIKSLRLDRERLELAIIENVQRANLNPIESARAFARLQDQFKLTQREIAARLGKSRESIANTVRLLQLPTQIQDAVSKGQVSESQGRLLLSVVDLSHQHNLFEDLLRNNLSVRELKHRIQKTKPAMETIAAPAPIADPVTEQLQKELEEALGAKVSVERSGETGKLIITFYSPEELQGIVEKLKASPTNPNNPLDLPPEDSVSPI